MLAAALAVLLSFPAAARAGDASAGLLSRIDRVLADPSDYDAKLLLGEAAAEAAAEEKAAAARERAELLAGAEKDHARLQAMRAEKEERLGRWSRRFEKACGLAGAPATAGRAVDEYERLLETFPVYSDSGPVLREAGNRIMRIFYETVRRDYPYLAAGRESADARMLASLQFARSSEEMADKGGGVYTRVAEAEIRRADRLEATRQRVLKQLENISSGLTLIRRRRWAEALPPLEEVLAWDRGNEEALYYRRLARERAGAVKEKR